MATIHGILDWLAHGFIVVLLLILVALLIGVFPSYMNRAQLEVRVTELEERFKFMRQVIVDAHIPHAERDPNDNASTPR